MDDPCSLFTAGLLVWLMGNAASEGRPKLRKFGAALAGAALLAAYFHGMSRREAVFDNLAESVALALFVLGSCWIVLSLIAFGHESLPKRTALPPPPPPRPEPVPPRQAPPAPPPLPPPPAPAERAKAARERYDEKLWMLEAAGLDATELAAARAQAKQQYLRDLDGIIQ